jgi:hypothetical protein
VSLATRFFIKVLAATLQVSWKNKEPAQRLGDPLISNLEAQRKAFIALSDSELIISRVLP